MFTSILFLSMTVVLAGPVANWPPVVQKEFPNIKMIDGNGKDVELSSFKGKTLLIEPVGMSCAGCQAFSGGHKFGAYEFTQPQPGLKSLEEYLPEWGGGVQLSDPRLTFIQIIFYDSKLKPATKEDIVKWRKHYKLERANTFVFAAKKEFQDHFAMSMIPGFFLVDRKFILVSEATGSNPKTNLYTEFMPQIKKVLDAKL